MSLKWLLPFGKLINGVLHVEESFSLECTEQNGSRCVLLEALTSFVGENAPKLQIELSVNGQEKPLYVSHSYRIGKNREYTRQEWRTPPLFLPEIKLTVHFKIPSGTVLKVLSFGMSQSSVTNEWHGGLRHNAHLGLWGLAPDNTMPAFELAAASGFPACIVVPKVTKDGVFVCIHDDTINRTARDRNGVAPEESIYVWDKTYDELCEWEYGSYKNEIYKGAKLPRLSDFFDLCAKTGMIPMFSTHPGLTVEQWEQVKEMLESRGLLKNFHIKSFRIEILKTAFSVFGNDIDGYTFDTSNWSDEHIDAVKNIGIDEKLCRVGIEFRFDDYTEQIAEKIRKSGFFAAAWSIRQRDFSEYERLISWGVTEFTEDYHCSMGLNY